MSELETPMNEATTSRTELVDAFLEMHGAFLPGHVVDFALDIRTLIAEMEELLAERTPVVI